MNEIFTKIPSRQKLLVLLVLLLLTGNINATTPVLNGAYSSEEGWGAARASNPTAGWAGANAQNLYVTSDANYIYFGAQVEAASWQSWGFAINASGNGGIPTDVWTYPIIFNHNPKPDYVVRGNFEGYAELRQWNGTNSHNFIFSLADNDKGISTSMVEVRIPRSNLGNPSSVSVQFYITGNNAGEHATFDAVPQDAIATSWNTSTTLQNYATNIDVSYSPPVFPVTFEVTNLNPANTEILIKGSFNNWTTVPMTDQGSNLWSKTFEIAAGTYEWGVVNQEDVWLIVGPNLSFTVDATGNISGQTTYTIPAPPAPVLTFASLHWPGSATIETGSNIDIYSQVEVDNAVIDPDDGIVGLSVWVGISNENTNPNTWTTWIPAYYAGISGFTSRPEYLIAIGADITEAGTYYYASRFKLNEGDFVYGGFSNDGGGFWDGTVNTSGVLTVEDIINVFPVTFEVTNLNPANTEILIKGSFNNWTIVPMTDQGSNLWSKTFEIAAGTYEWGVVNQEDVWLIVGTNLNFTVDAAGNISGQITYTIPAPPAPVLTFASLHWPGIATIETGSNIDIYSQVEVENAVIDPDDGIPGLSVWVGISNENTNPATWTTWIPAYYAGISGFTSRPEHLVTIGADITEAGTYYYASRFKLNDEDFVYGGFSNDGGGYWDGTTNVSGVLTVEDIINVFPVTFEVTNLNPANTEILIKGSFNNWTTVPMTDQGSNLWSKTFEIAAGTYEWGVVNQEDVWLIVGPNLNFTVDAAGNISGQTTYTIPAPQTMITFANLQWPGAATILTGESVDVYAQVLAPDANFTPDQGYENMQVWIGLSSENTHPSNWTEWIPAPYSGIGAFTNRPEYMTAIGASITEEGTYYFASRFQLEDGAYVFGGYNSSGGGFWDGTTNVSGVLTVLDEIQYFPVTFEVTNLNPANTEIWIKGSFNDWNTVIMEYQGENVWSKTFDVAVGSFEWGVVNQDNDWLIVGPNLGFSVDAQGNISGQTTYFIPGPQGTAELLDAWVIYTANQQTVSIGANVFNGGNLGTFNSLSSLILNGGGIKTFKSGTYDIVGGEFIFRIYKEGQTPGEFESINLPWKENLPEEGEQIWENAQLNLNLTQGLSSGTYFLEVFFVAYYTTQPEGEVWAIVDNNDEEFYKAFFTFDNDISVNEWNLDQTVNIFPNPSSDILNVELTNLNAVQSIRIMDMHGKLVLEEVNPNAHRIALNVSSWNRGLYFIEIQTTEGIIRKKAVIGR